MQAYINETQARFAPIFWPSLLTRKQEDSLRWDTIIGDRKSGVAGNVTAFNVSVPLHGRDALREQGGKIPSILAVGYFLKDYQVTQLNKELVTNVEELLREQLPKAVKDEVRQQVKPIAESVSTIKSNIDKFIEKFE